MVLENLDTYRWRNIGPRMGKVNLALSIALRPMELFIQYLIVIPSTTNPGTQYIHWKRMKSERPSNNFVGSGSLSPCIANNGAKRGMTPVRMTVTASTATISMMAGYAMAPFTWRLVLRCFARSLATRAIISSNIPLASAARTKLIMSDGNIFGHLARADEKSIPSQTSSRMVRANSATTGRAACSANVSSDSFSVTPVRSMTAICEQNETVSSLRNAFSSRRFCVFALTASPTEAPASPS